MTLYHHINRRGAAVGKHKTVYACMRDDGQVWPIFGWMQIGFSGAAASSTFHGVLVARKPLLLATVEVIGQRKARLLTRLDKSIQQDVIAAVGFRYRQGAIVAVIAFVSIAFKGLGSLEIRQDLGK